MLLLEPETLESICDFIGSGKGGLDLWCREKDVRFTSVYFWIHDDKERLKRFSRVIEARSARYTEKVLGGMERIIDSDLRHAVGKNGKLLPIRKLPASVGMLTEVSESSRGDRKVKIVSPDRGVEMMGRHLGMFRDKVEVTHEVGLSSRLSAARQRAGKPK